MSRYWKVKHKKAHMSLWEKREDLSISYFKERNPPFISKWEDTEEQDLEMCGWVEISEEEAIIWFITNGVTPYHEK